MLVTMVLAQGCLMSLTAFASGMPHVHAVSGAADHHPASSADMDGGCGGECGDISLPVRGLQEAHVSLVPVVLTQVQMAEPVTLVPWRHIASDFFGPPRRSARQRQVLLQIFII